MTALYELANLREVIDSALQESEGEVTPEIAAALDAWEEAFPVKVESVALYICDLEGDAAKIKAEEEKLASRRSTLLNRAKSLSSYLQTQLERTGTDKIKGTLKTVALQLNPPRVEPLTDMDEAELRNIFMFAPQYVTRVPESYQLSKKAILDAHKAGTLDADMSKRVKITQVKSLRIR